MDRLKLSSMHVPVGWVNTISNVTVMVSSSEWQCGCDQDENIQVVCLRRMVTLAECYLSLPAACLYFGLSTERLWNQRTISMSCHELQSVSYRKPMLALLDTYCGRKGAPRYLVQDNSEPRARGRGILEPRAAPVPESILSDDHDRTSS